MEQNQPNEIKNDPDIIQDSPMRLSEAPGGRPGGGGTNGGDPVINNADTGYENSFRYSDPYLNPGVQESRGKRSPVMKAVMLTISIVILIIASALVFMDTDDAGFRLGFPRDGLFPDGEFPDDGSPEDYGDFDDYFDSYYDSSEADIGDIPTGETGTGVQMDIFPSQNGEDLSLQDIYKKCSASVVGITGNVDETGYYWGTGIIMTDDGYIVTNNHIISSCNSVTVTLYDGREFSAKLIGADSQSDLAVIKIEAAGLTGAEFGDSGEIEVGESVVAIGNPLGEELRGTMTDGIISAINRNITYDGHTMTLLQTNAAINEGNSGGPLINMHGQVIGITNMKMISYYSNIEGIGFAIPASSMKPVVDELIEKGYIGGRTALGVTIGTIPETAASYFTLPDGLYIDSVVKNSDAYEKGIRPGDILIAVNGEAVSTTDEVNLIKDSLKVGDTMTLTIYRSGETFDVDVVLMEQNEIYG
jgi:serine protease Do